eukprot:TRINITY_DN1429_c0_g4_i1.p1 TRINITY_DN1429_c0_g4~~TRINITY_DN1429_c0_g4_i1.p1  ORF type:complete len:300 (+),score=119.37 TRINITY_DN1429_c0_g4_i1:46-900(+)
MDAKGGVGESAAVSHAECPICFEPLCEQPVAGLLHGADIRACRHFFHHTCMTEFAVFTGTEEKGECPMCRAEFTSIDQLPNPTTDADRLFHFIDVDRSGNLTPEEVVDVVRATCNVSEDDIEKLVEQKWGRWDKDKSKGIEWKEFPDLLKFILESLPKGALTITPSITQGRDEWFDYWDRDRSGYLDKDEVARALIKTFGKNGYRTVKQLQAVIESVWPLFDPDHSNTITREEFLIHDGLADTICACLLNQNQWTMTVQSPAPAQSPLRSPIAFPAPVPVPDCA